MHMTCIYLPANITLRLIMHIVLILLDLQILLWSCALSSHQALENKFALELHLCRDKKLSIMIEVSVRRFNCI